VADWLAGERFDAIYASTMRRAIETAEPSAKARSAEIATHAGIVEFDRDAGTYIPMEALKREDYAAWKALATGDHAVDIVGFQATVVAALEELIEAHPSQTIAVFCHGGVINVWTAHILGMKPRLFFEPVYTSIHRYRCARTGQRNLVSLNETAHLRG
jgi:probable phosphoglycerate mutase